MTTKGDSSIKEVLSFIERRDYKNHKLSSNLVVAATREYEKIKQSLKLSERQKLGYIESILRSVDYAKWNEAEGLLDAAESEFYHYLAPYIADLKRQNFTRDEPDSWKAALTTRPTSQGGTRRADDIDRRTDGHRSERQYLLSAQRTPSRSSDVGTPISDRRDEIHSDRLAERFLSIYKNEWKDAFKELSHRGRQSSVADDNKIIDFLYQIVEDSYHVHAKRLADRQISNLEEQIDRVMTFGVNDRVPPVSQDRNQLLKYRKCYAALSVQAVIDSFLKGPLKEIQQRLRMTGSIQVEKYAAACTEVTWWMCVQDPPVLVDDPAGKKFTDELYQAYTSAGTHVDFYVWPALFLGNKLGHILAKGVAQCR